MDEKLIFKDELGEKGIEKLKALKLKTYILRREVRIFLILIRINNFHFIVDSISD